MSTPKPNGPPNTPPPPSVNHSDASIRGPFVLDPTSPAATTKDPTSQAQGQSSTTAEAQDNVVHLRRSPGAPNFLKTEDLNDMESASAEPTHIGSPQSERDVKRRKTRRGSGVRAKEKKAYEAYLRQGDRSLHTSGALPNAPAPTASEAGQPSLLQHRMFNFKRAPPTTGASATSAFSAFPTASSGGAGAFVAGSGTTSAFAPRSGVSAFAGFGRPSTTPLSVDSGTEAAPAFVPTRGVSAFAGFGRPPTAQPAPDLATVTASPSALSSDSGGFAGFGPRPAAQPLLDSDSGTGSTCTFPLSSGFSGFAGYGRPSAAPPGTAVGQTGRQVGDSGGVENGPVGVDAAEATTECDVELEEMAKKPIRQLQAKVKVLRSVNEKAMKERDVLRAELNTFKTLWNKVSPHYPLERALTDATTSKGRTLRKNMTPAKADDPEPTDCADESCRCIESRRDRALVPGWPANGWPSPRLLPDSMCDARIQDEIEIARTHPSFVTNVLKSYKDLGHVGDNVVELSVRIMIVMAADSRLPRTHFRTRLKTWCVANSTLALLAKHWGLLDHIRITPKMREEMDETKLGGDVAESHICVMFKTHGWNATSEFLCKVYTPIIGFLVEEMKAQRLA